MYDHTIFPEVVDLPADYPDIQVDIVIEYGMIDIVAQRYDAGVRLGDQVAKDMIAVRVAPDLRMASRQAMPQRLAHAQTLTVPGSARSWPSGACAGRARPEGLDRPPCCRCQGGAGHDRPLPGGACQMGCCELASTIERMRSAMASIENGLVSTAMPGSR